MVSLLTCKNVFTNIKQTKEVGHVDADPGNLFIMKHSLIALKLYEEKET